MNSEMKGFLPDMEQRKVADLSTGYEQPMSYNRALRAFGDGDIRRGQQNIFMLAKRLEEARKKHPLWDKGPWYALGVVGEEYREFVRAVEHETPDRQLDEALDVACTAMRFVNREYKQRLAKVVRKGKKKGRENERKKICGNSFRRYRCSVQCLLCAYTI